MADPAALHAELAREAALLARAEALLGHTFHRRELLLEALTHASLLNEQPSSVRDNEVLELLGDAVLSLVTVETLVHALPGAGEGTLTELRAAHVSEPSLAACADARGLTPLLRAGRGVQGHIPVSARADLVEAVLAAVYLDGGLGPARAVAHRLLGSPPVEVPLVPRGGNAKRTLQERLQGLFGEPPTYVVERDGGAHHAPVYRARAVFRGESLGAGAAGSKRAATERAAEDALTLLGSDEELQARFPPAGRSA